MYFVGRYLQLQSQALMQIFCKLKPVVTHIKLQTEIILPCTGSLFYLTIVVCHFLQLHDRATGPGYVGLRQLSKRAYRKWHTLVVG